MKGPLKYSGTRAGRWSGEGFVKEPKQVGTAREIDQLTEALTLAQVEGTDTLTIMSLIGGNSVTFCINCIQTGAHRLFPTMEALRALIRRGSLKLTRINQRYCDQCRRGDRAKDEPRLIKLRHRGQRS